MRTAVVRVHVDPGGELAADELVAGMAALAERVRGTGADLLAADLTAMPAHRREVELLMAGTDPEALKRTAMSLCHEAFGTEPAAGVLTWISRGTDEDAAGVLAGFGLTGRIARTPGDDGCDVVEVTLRKADLARVPESRIHTALEASLNAEVRILAE
ncbi:hypothetical protein LV457_18360 [Mycobacterium sp. MYCO198283]|uniref:hypothetical protein n=1 Tax=Mycobacterium sp. MYCO198283 TaxID=2883505 RepID=UPI001E3F9E10|nr:hypothetical protein [Mycobacterium sp. MYCO198283]MCG5434239.1 hypothetical protein [Mycobacterium sp. MYCO198283]